MNKMAIVIIPILVAAAGILGTITMSGTAFAQLEKDPGASGLTPKEEPKIPGWDPGLAPNDAPGKVEGPHCIGCAKDVAPGSEGLESGAIGPKK